MIISLFLNQELKYSLQNSQQLIYFYFAKYNTDAINI